MHEVFKIESSKPIQKLHKNLFDFEKPQFCKNPKNLGFKEWNAWKWENRSLPSEEKLDETRKMLEEEVRSERESVWEMNRCGQIERDRGNENWIVKNIYIDPQ